MMTLRDVVGVPVQRAAIWTTRYCVNRGLLRENDRTLADLGLSRVLLEAGVHEWPWREACEAHTAISVVHAKPAAEPLATARTAAAAGRVGVTIDTVSGHETDWPKAA